jgi:hypothetical protein
MAPPGSGGPGAVCGGRGRGRYESGFILFYRTHLLSHGGSAPTHPPSCRARCVDGAHADALEQALRNLNAVTVPAFVSVPKNEEEDRKKGN